MPPPAPLAVPPAAETAKLPTSPPAAETAKLTTPPPAAETAKLPSPAPAAETTKLPSTPPAEETTKLASPPKAAEPVSRSSAAEASPQPRPGSVRPEPTSVQAPKDANGRANGPAPTQAAAERVAAVRALLADRVSKITGGGRNAADRPAGPSGTSAIGVRRLWLISGLVGLLLLIVAVAVPLLRNSSTDDDAAPPEPVPTGQPSAPASAAAPTVGPASPTQAQPPTAPSPTASSTGLPQPTVPDGWRLHRDRTGFSVPVPANWRVTRDGPRVKFNDPNSRLFLMIDQTDSPKSDPVADWTQQERYRKGNYRNYQRVTIRAVDYWLKAADWEWLHTVDGVRMHVRNRGFVTAKDKAYAIRWDAPADQWEESLAMFEIIADGFRPARY